MTTRTQVAISLTEFSLWSTCRIEKAIAIVIQESHSSTLTHNKQQNSNQSHSQSQSIIKQKYLKSKELMNTRCLLLTF